MTLVSDSSPADLGLFLLWVFHGENWRWNDTTLVAASLREQDHQQHQDQHGQEAADPRQRQHIHFGVLDGAGATGATVGGPAGDGARSAAWRAALARPGWAVTTAEFPLPGSSRACFRRHTTLWPRPDRAAGRVRSQGGARAPAPHRNPHSTSSPVRGQQVGPVRVQVWMTRTPAALAIDCVAGCGRVPAGAAVAGAALAVWQNGARAAATAAGFSKRSSGRLAIIWRRTAASAGGMSGRRQLDGFRLDLAVIHQFFLPRASGNGGWPVSRKYREQPRL